MKSYEEALLHMLDKKQSSLYCNVQSAYRGAVAMTLACVYGMTEQKVMDDIYELLAVQDIAAKKAKKAAHAAENEMRRLTNLAKVPSRSCGDAEYE